MVAATLAAGSGQRDSVTDQAFTDPKACAGHLAQQRLDIADGEQTCMAGFYHDPNGADDSDAACLRDLTTLILVHDQTGTELARKDDRLGLASIQFGQTTEVGDRFVVAWHPNREPGCRDEVRRSGSATADPAWTAGGTMIRA